MVKPQFAWKLEVVFPPELVQDAIRLQSTVRVHYNPLDVAIILPKSENLVLSPVRVIALFRNKSQADLVNRMVLNWWKLVGLVTRVELK